VLSGPSILHALQEAPRHFDVVLLDLSLPLMSGQDVMRELHKSVLPCDHSAVVACTGLTDTDTLTELR
jgi:CheY-like chemotaxis protein